MKFEILEGKQELLAKYGDRFKDKQSFDTIYNLIPLNLKGYGDWVFKNVLEQGKSPAELVDALNTFVKYKDRLEVKDINKYSSKEDVEKAIFYAQEKGSKKEKLYNAEIVYENENVKVVIPLTHEASRHYGTGTNWCTATANPEHFYSYKSKGKLFYILPKDGKDKYAIFSYFKFNYKDEQKMEGFNKKDESVNPKKIIKKFGLNEQLFSALLVFDFKTKKGVKEWLDFFGIKNYTISEDLVVDVKGGVDLSFRNLKNIPVVFGKITEVFYCSYNKLTSLEGAPQEVGGIFNCSNNKLTSLEGAPKEVGGSFNCSNNKLTSLEGVPQKAGRNFYCFYNKLTSLEGAPKEVGGSFDCLYNNLTSLEGAPKEVGGSFDCSNNNLTSLEGAPKEVGGSFYCSNNPLPESEIERVKKIYKNVIESVRRIKFKVIE